MPNPVDRMNDDLKALIHELQGQPSLQVSINDNFRKALLLASASYFETQLASSVAAFVVEASGASTLLSALVKAKAIDRQYHTWFDWNSRNANKFYRLFGDEFVHFMEEKHRTEVWLNPAVLAFIELGRTRNTLVHENFAAFTLEKTAEEIFTLYENANQFVAAVPAFLTECSQLNRQQEAG